MKLLQKFSLGQNKEEDHRPTVVKRGWIRVKTLCLRTFRPVKYARQEFEGFRVELEKNIRKEYADFGIYRTIFNHMGEGVGYSNGSETLSHPNPAANLIFGLDQNNAEPIKLIEYVDATTYAIHIQMTQKRKEGEQSKYTFEITRPDGEKRFIELTATPHFAGGKYAGTVGVFSDATQRFAIDTEMKALLTRLQTANEQKDLYFSLIGHELRTPYNALMGFGQMMLEEAEKKGDAEEIEIAGAIYASAQRGWSLTNRILEWTKSQMQNHTLKMEMIDPREAVRLEISELSAQAKFKDVKLQNRVLTGQNVFANDEALGAVLRNLISNAIKFSPDGETVTVVSKRTDERLLIRIEDHGAGMEPEMIGKLFGEEMISTPGTRKEMGTGFGLKIVRNYMAKMGGEVTVESEVGAGTTFVVSLRTSPPTT